MKDNYILKSNDKYSLVYYTGAVELNKVNKEFIKENSKFIDILILKRMKQGFLGYEVLFNIEGLNITFVEEIKFRLVKEITDIIKKLEKGKNYSLLVNDDLAITTLINLN